MNADKFHEKAQENAAQSDRQAEEARKYIEKALKKKKGKLKLPSQEEFIHQAALLSPLHFAILRKEMVAKLGMNVKDFESAVESLRPTSAHKEDVASHNDDGGGSLLKEFNDRYFIVGHYGGKCHVCWIETDEKLGRSIQHQSFDDFRHRFQHRLVTVAVKKPQGGTALVEKSEGDFWLDHPDRRQFDKIVFKPQEETPKEIFNLWQGFAYGPKEGDCSLYLTHLRDNVCRGNRGHYDWLVNYMAYHVQNPNQQGHSCIVIFGLKGVGKNIAAETFSKLWGAHGVTVNDQKRVTGNFNNHLRDKCVLVADEAFFAGDPRQDRVLKSLITGDTLTIEAKGVDTIVVPNLLRVFVLANDRHVVRATFDERRYLVLECGDAQRDNHEYFVAIKNQLTENNGAGYSALLYHLLSVDLTGFNVRKPPHTDALREQMVESTEGALSILREMLSCGQIPGTVKPDGRIVVNLNQLLLWAIRQRAEWSRVKFQALKEMLGVKGLGLKPTQQNVYEAGQAAFPKRLRVWVLPTLGKCRQLFFDKFQFKDSRWDDDAEDWESTSELRSGGDDVCPIEPGDVETVGTDVLPQPEAPGDERTPEAKARDARNCAALKDWEEQLKQGGVPLPSVHESMDENDWAVYGQKVRMWHIANGG